MKLVLAGHGNNWKDLEDIEPESFDIALLFDDSSESVNKIAEALNIPNEKLLPLW